ncbi:MAG: CopG family transcriptional regulator [Acidimicrobiia bacterium]|nr:ribbon-helix-helix protein, CopG family [Acidimicrobiia bacterium]MDQ3500787.1 ribbon-helix-helix domain-containing protein [Actinomycetota bacterium]
MIRTEVRLGEEQHKSLKQLAAERGVSLAALIREGVDRLLSENSLVQGWEIALGSPASTKAQGATSPSITTST